MHVPEFDERLQELTQACAARGRSINDIDITLLTMVESEDQLAQLKAKGVNRIVLTLPTLARDESLAVLDGYADIIEWAQGL